MTAPTPAYSPRGLDRLEALAAREPLALAVTDFWFLRHGQTEGNRTRTVQPAHIDLNPTGLAQAEEAARRLADQPVRRIVASDMTRAWTTAGIAGRALGLVPVAAPALRERWFGDLVGGPSAGLDWAASPPNGETPTAFVDRVRAGVAAALADGEATLLVSHGGVLHVLIAALGLVADPAHLANAAPLRFGRDGAGWRITPLLPEAQPVAAGSLS